MNSNLLCKQSKSIKCHHCLAVAATVTVSVSVDVILVTVESLKRLKFISDTLNLTHRPGPMW